MAGLYPDAPRAGDVPFTDAARELLAGARAEADRLRHEYIGTEHVVLAMTQFPEAEALLAHFGLDGAQVRSTLDAIVTPPRAALPSGLPSSAERPYTSRTRQAFGFALESAAAHGHPAVGVEHIVVGLLRERENIGAQVLQEYGLSVDRAADAVRQRRDGGGTERQ